MVKALTLAMLVALAACQTVPRAQFCQIAKPIRPSQQTIDAMSDREVTELLSFLEKGKRLCGWRSS